MRIARGLGGMLSREIFLNGANWCVLGCILIRFCLYFFLNYHFLYKKINNLDTLLLWGISHGEIFENMLRLIRFGVYFENIMAIFIKKYLYMLGARGHMLHEKFLKIWCSFVSFGVYFDQNIS